MNATDKNFPYWPPQTPQWPSVIAGRQSMTVIQDLAINQIPRGRGDEIILRPKPLPRIRKPELPADPELHSQGAVQGSLYDLMMLTETMPADELFRAMNSGG